MTFEQNRESHHDGDLYGEITLDETWALRDEPSRLRSELARGFAISRSHSGNQAIEAFTASDRAPDLAAALLAPEVLESHRDNLIQSVLQRTGDRDLTLRAVFAHVISGRDEIFRSVVRIETAAGESVLTTPAQLDGDLVYLLDLPGHIPEMPPPHAADLPTLWTAGAGGVLMHEAAGHPASIGATLRWPPWLEVRDEPGTELFEKMICGAVAESIDLLETSPRTLRRATFRDYPLHRLTNVVVAAPGAPFQLPEAWIEIELTAGGAWDPLLDEVRVDVSRATLVEGESRSPLPPFVFTATRPEIAAALTGARGDVTRYRGVLCSEQGQWLPVGTFSPDLLLEPVR